jgi:hypothetical protein
LNGRKTGDGNRKTERQTQAAGALGEVQHAHNTRRRARRGSVTWFIARL